MMGGVLRLQNYVRQQQAATAQWAAAAAASTAEQQECREKNDQVSREV